MGDSRVVVGSQCFSKILAPAYGEQNVKLLMAALAPAVQAVFLKVFGLDLSNPDDYVEPGDRVTLPGGQVAEADGSREDAEKYQSFVEGLASTLEYDKSGISTKDLAEKVDARVTELFDTIGELRESYLSAAKRADDAESAVDTIRELGRRSGVTEPAMIGREYTLEVVERVATANQNISFAILAAVAPLLERLLGPGVEATTESCALALEALGPTPEF